jgi:hypothetical protein
MSIKEMKAHADGTVFTKNNTPFYKWADGLYCPANHHLYTWWNIEFNKMNEGMQTEAEK